MAYPQVVVQCRANPIPFYNEVPTLNILGQAPYTDQIQDWQYKQMPYYSKWKMEDVIALQFHTQYNPDLSGQLPQLYICDYTKTVISAIDLNDVANPYIKYSPTSGGAAYQVLSGNVLRMNTSVVPLVTTMWSFSFADFTPDITDGGVYYIKLVNGFTAQDDQILYSEPILVSNQDMDTRPITYQYNANNGVKNLVVSGWYYNNGTDSAPYTPEFTLRVECYRTALNPKALAVGYLQQSYNPVTIKTEQKRYWKFNVGDISIGIPEWMLEKVTEAILSDNWTLDGYGYTIPFSGSNASLNDIWKIRESDVNPLRYAETIITEQVTNNKLYGRQVFPDAVGIFTDEFDSTFA